VSCPQPRLPADRRLPLCYVMDSILKNIGPPFPHLFSRDVLQITTKAFMEVRRAMGHYQGG
jgi:hypothetical protein